MSDTPLPNDINGNGRDTSGRFAKGNAGGPGNPYARQVAELRAAALEQVSREDMKALVAKLIELGKGGNVAAIRELFDRLLGKSAQSLQITADTGTIASEEEVAALLAELREGIRKGVT